MAYTQRKIQIYGISHRRDSEEAPYVKVSYHGFSAAGKVPSNLMPTDPNYLLSDFRWNLEDFATKDPFNATRAKKVDENITLYTSLLIDFVLGTLQHPDDLLGSKLVIKLSDKWVGSSLPSATSNGANIVPLIQWECLEETNLWPAKHRPESVVVVRCTTCKNIQEGGLSTPVKDGKSVRILALSARPQGDRDIPHRLITRTMYRVIESLQNQQYPPELYIARPGSLEGLERALSSHEPGYFDIVHLDVHGIADLEGAMLLFLQDTEATKVQYVQARQLAEVLCRFGVRCVVMNACQSAALVHNFAKSLVQEGLAMVLGMQCKLLETAAEILATSLYQDLLLRGRSMAEACSHVRLMLRNQPRRRTKYNTTVEVIDYMNPILFMAEEFEESEPPSTNGQCETPMLFSPSEQDLLGRESTILDMENDFLTISNLLFLYGSAGSGKSALVEHLSWWWKVTGLINGTLRVDFATFGSFEWDSIVKSLCNQLEIATVSNEDELVQHLQSHRLLVLFDTIDELDILTCGPLISAIIKMSKAIRKASKKSKNASLVLFAGRHDKPGIRSKTGAQEFPLRKLDASSSLQISFNILQSNSKIITATDSASAAHMEEIVSILQGNPLAIELVMNDFAKRADDPCQYYQRLTSNRQIKLDGSANAKRAIQQALQLIDMPYVYAPLSETLTKNYIAYLSPYWNMIPANLASYWKFSELAMNRIQGKKSKCLSPQALKVAAEAMDDNEKAFFYDRNTSMDIFDPKELEVLNAEFARTLAKLPSTEFLGESVYRNFGFSVTNDSAYYRIHPILTICLRSMLDDDNLSNPDDIIARVALARFYERRTIISWLDRMHYDEAISNGSRKQLAFEFENYVTSINFTLSMKLTEYNHKCIKTDLIGSMTCRNNRSPIILLPVLERGIEYHLEILRAIQPTAFSQYRTSLDLFLQRMIRKLTKGFSASTDDIDRAVSYFCIIGVTCASLVYDAVIYAARLGYDLDRYNTQTQELKHMAASDYWAAPFRSWVDVVEQLLRFWSGTFVPDGDAMKAAQDTTYLTLSHALGTTETLDDALKIGDLPEPQKYSFVLNQNLQQLKVDVGKVTKTMETISVEEITPLEERAHKLLLEALLNKRDPKEILDLHGILAYLAVFRNDLGCAEEHLKSFNQRLALFPVDEEPWRWYRDELGKNVQDLISNKRLLAEL